MDKERGIPVMYDIYPGSISEVSTLSLTLQKIRAHGIQDYIAIMDRGFFSQGNLEELMDDQLNFIMAAKLQLKVIRTRLVNKMEIGLLDKYSVELLLMQLDKLRKITLADGQVVTTEITKKQRDLLDALKICA